MEGILFMKYFGKILIVLAIVVPIIYCWKTLQTVWEDDEFAYSGDYVGESSKDLEEVEQLINNEEQKVTASNLGDGVEYDITGINITSKVYENAEVAISLANVYEEHNENSKVLGKLEKGSLITIQNYDNGWSTVTNYTLSGWMKTENIKLPEDETNMVLTPTDGTKLGTVKVNDSLNVRASASTSAEVIKSLTNGTIVTILETSNGWHKVKVDGVEGWVSADYIVIQ